MENKKTIILVDDNITNLIVGKEALSETYNTLTVPSAEKLFNLLDTLTPDLILLDVKMPDMDGYEVIQILKEDPTKDEIPVIFLTSKNDNDSELKGLSLGAIDYISKPFSPPLLRKRIETHLIYFDQQKELTNYNKNLKSIVKEKTQTVIELQNAVLNTVAELVECRDDVTGGHISRTQKYLRVLLDEMIREGIYEEEVSTWDLDFILPSSQLHDVGKIMVPDNILKKPGKLTDEEFEEIKKHAEYGANIIDMISENATDKAFLNHARIFALNHHEKWDGTGYPNRLKGEEIPLQGRLMAIADVYDALVSERPYKPPMPHEEARQIIVEGSGKQFDPALITAFGAVENKYKEIMADSEKESWAMQTANSVGA